MVRLRKNTPKPHILLLKNTVKKQLLPLPPRLLFRIKPWSHTTTLVCIFFLRHQLLNHPQLQAPPNKLFNLKISIPKPAWIIFYACALHWVWGCSLIFSTEPSRIAAWDAFSQLSNLLLGLLFMTVATLSYTALYRQRSAWLILPQQVVLSVTAFSQSSLIAAGHYADWVVRPPFFIFRDQIWGILLALFHLISMLMIAHENKSMSKIHFKNLLNWPFESGVAVYTVLNALLTFSPQSAVLSNLWQLIGGYSLIAVCYQLFAAASVLYGLLCNRIHIEIMGLIMLCSTFSIRAIALMSDSDITISDLNSTLLAIVLVVCSAARVVKLTYMRSKCPSQI